MYNDYHITYNATNTYENWVKKAYWQFLIVPMENNAQKDIKVAFENSMGFPFEYSINGYGFKTLRIRAVKPLKEISFTAYFSFLKKSVNPFNFVPNSDISWEYAQLALIDYRVNHDLFLRTTPFTQLPGNARNLFVFDTMVSIFDNLRALNKWIFYYIKYVPGVTDVHTTLDRILKGKHGVCQDFAHLFCALGRHYGVPTRYVSGYLNQDGGFMGDSQMHAWVEAHVPGVGWIGFDPTNNILANSNHVKVCHGKDYTDCAPLKGVVFTQGANTTSHTVSVHSQQ